MSTVLLLHQWDTLQAFYGTASQLPARDGVLIPDGLN